MKLGGNNETTSLNSEAAPNFYSGFGNALILPDDQLFCRQKVTLTFTVQLMVRLPKRGSISLPKDSSYALEVLIGEDIT